jgi:hypothetical protein
VKETKSDPGLDDLVLAVCDYPKLKRLRAEKFSNDDNKAWNCRKLPRTRGYRRARFNDRLRSAGSETPATENEAMLSIKESGLANLKHSSISTILAERR